MRLQNTGRRLSHRRIPSLNTTATADMSFILLIFFLLTSSMDTNRGLRHNMPPREEKKEIQLRDIDRNDVFAIRILKNGTYLANDTLRSSVEVMREMERFVKNVGDRHVIEITAEREASYNSYFKLQNVISLAYNRLRNAEAQKRCKKEYARCGYEEQVEIQKAVPQRVCENFIR